MKGQLATVSRVLRYKLAEPLPRQSAFTIDIIPERTVLEKQCLDGQFDFILKRVQELGCKWSVTQVTEQVISGDPLWP